MGQQLKARIKRRRRQDYLERKKIAAKTTGISVAKPKAKPKPKAAAKAPKAPKAPKAAKVPTEAAAKEEA